MGENLKLFTRRLNKIIDREIREAEFEGNGATDVDTVYRRVKKSCSTFIDKLLDWFKEQHLKNMIRHRLKHPGGRRSGKASSSSYQRAASEAFREREDEQLVFPGMEEFRGYPPKLSYEDEPGHVKFVNSRRSVESDRDQAEKYAEKLSGWFIKRNQKLKAGNRFARTLVKAYGDLPLEELVERWQKDHGAESAEL